MPNQQSKQPPSDGPTGGGNTRPGQHTSPSAPARSPTPPPPTPQASQRKGPSRDGQPSAASIRRVTAQRLSPDHILEPERRQAVNSASPNNFTARHTNHLRGSRLGVLPGFAEVARRQRPRHSIRPPLITRHRRHRRLVPHPTLPPRLPRHRRRKINRDSQRHHQVVMAARLG